MSVERAQVIALLALVGSWVLTGCPPPPDKDEGQAQPADNSYARVGTRTLALTRINPREGDANLHTRDAAGQLRENHPAVLEALIRTSAFKRFQQATASIDFKHESGNGEIDGETYYLIEDDIAVTRDELVLLACRHTDLLARIRGSQQQDTLGLAEGVLPGAKGLPPSSEEKNLRGAVEALLGHEFQAYVASTTALHPGEPASKEIAPPMGQGIMGTGDSGSKEIMGTGDSGSKNDDGLRLAKACDFLRNETNCKFEVADRRDLGVGDLVPGSRGGTATLSPMGIVKEFGRGVAYKPGAVIPFRVNTLSFGDNAEVIHKACEQAAKEWNSICNVRFSCLCNDPNAWAYFSVKFSSLRGGLHALAFFPGVPAKRRVLRIDPSYFTQKQYDRVGILRHEFGHVLGFVHEHLAAPIELGVPPEKTCRKGLSPFPGTVLVTSYDEMSVMHLLCEGKGNSNLTFSSLDLAGAAAIYPF